MSVNVYQKGKRKDNLISILTKSGAVNKGNPSTFKGDALQSQFKISNEEYIKLCDDNNMLPDGSHIEDETQAKEYKDSIADKIKETGKKVMNKDRILTFRGSDETVDRYGDIVRVKGWELINYKKNPVFLIFHEGKSFPVGRTVKVWKEYNDAGAPERRSLMFYVYFPESEEKDMWPDFVFNQFNDGLMNAVSVGFNAIEYNYPDNTEERQKIGLGQYGVEFIKQELLELSAVTVPANQNALLVKNLDQEKRAKLLFGNDVQIKRLDKSNEDDQKPNEDPELTDAQKLIQSIDTFAKSVKSMEKSIANFAEITKDLTIIVETKEVGHDVKESVSDSQNEGIETQGKSVYDVLFSESKTFIDSIKSNKNNQNEE